MRFIIVSLSKYIFKPTLFLNFFFQTRVLVTHGINFLPEVDQIIVLSQGKISEV